MTAPSVLLDMIAKVHGPNDIAYITTRAFLFADNENDGRLHAVIYRAEQGKAVPIHFLGITDWTRSRAPRSTPHTLTDDEGNTWSFYRGGCGCGSPIKKVTWRQAWSTLSESLTSDPATTSPATA